MRETLEISIKSLVNFYSLRFVDAVSKKGRRFESQWVSSWGWQINFDIRFLFPSISFRFLLFVYRRK